MPEDADTVTLPCGCVYTRPSWNEKGKLVKACDEHREKAR